LNVEAESYKRVKDRTVVVDEFNGKIAGIVRARSEMGRKVGVVGMGFLVKEDLSDGIHLNEGGNGNIARA